MSNVEVPPDECRTVYTSQLILFQTHCRPHQNKIRPLGAGQHQRVEDAMLYLAKFKNARLVSIVPIISKVKISAGDEMKLSKE